MKCSRCDSDATMKQGNQQLCDKHYRFGSMRASAKRHGKAVPTHEQLEEMVASGLTCPDCQNEMNWRAKDNRARVASLQHYRNGQMNIVCLSCNTRHASMKEDSYCDMPKDHKLCPKCSVIKPDTEFTVDNSRAGVIKRKSTCRECSDKTVNKWKKENQDDYNAYQRAYREKRKQEGRPITRNN